VISVMITRRCHPLEGQSLRVLGRMRRHGRLELLLELPDGSKRLIPQAWTDAEQDATTTSDGVATLGSVTDLLAVCALVGELAARGLDAPELDAPELDAPELDAPELDARELEARGQAARKSPSKEDFHAACPAQFDTRPAPAATGGAGRAASGGGARRGDRAAGRRDRQSERPGRDGGGRR
jgi:Family of unknown function (DUF5372)